MPANQEKKKELREQGEFHEELAKILKHPKFQDAVDDLADNAASRNEAKANARGYFQRKGVPLPAGANWTAEVTDGLFSVRICFFSWCWTWSI